MKKKLYKKSIGGCIFIFFLISIFIRLFILEPVLISNSEMLPTLLKNDYVIVQKYFYGVSLPFLKNSIIQYKSPKRGDVVLFKAPYSSHPLLIRRVIALPGDRLFYSKGILYINEKPYSPHPPEFLVKQERKFLRPSDFPGKRVQKKQSEDQRSFLEEWRKWYSHWQEKTPAGRVYGILSQKKEWMSFGPYKIPKGRVFVLGDHRTYARDSRTWPVKGKPSQGRVTFYRNKKSQSFLQRTSSIVIPKKTRLSIETDAYFPIFFETAEKAVLSQDSISVKVQSQSFGLNENIPAHQVWSIKGSLSQKVFVENSQPFFGGRDQSMVPLKWIKGRVFLIVWGCEKSFEFLSFLCHFNSFRKGRWFWPVHKFSNTF